MLFQATLIAVIAYLAACYAYGMYLLFKLYTNKRLRAAPSNLQENPRSLEDNTVNQTPENASTRDAESEYNAPAKAA